MLSLTDFYIFRFTSKAGGQYLPNFEDTKKTREVGGCREEQ